MDATTPVCRAEAIAAEAFARHIAADPSWVSKYDSSGMRIGAASNSEEATTAGEIVQKESWINIAFTNPNGELCLPRTAQPRFEDLNVVSLSVYTAQFAKHDKQLAALTSVVFGLQKQLLEDRESSERKALAVAALADLARMRSGASLCIPLFLL
eukprot:TRINITY_DN54778_c0_g1_i1.p2 TRINITY_DN54778_c0_g1~~TRINITY_DN54778_c0_g1_i1.p2  ORF type:complete len:155 (+),score=26.98 TRINITY_DN54778_c0_g1_i1:191-655(+)